MPTLALTGASARTTYTGSKETLRMSACAAAKPARDSRITSAGSLISFFMWGSAKNVSPLSCAGQPLRQSRLVPRGISQRARGAADGAREHYQHGRHEQNDHRMVDEGHARSRRAVG